MKYYLIFFFFILTGIWSAVVIGQKVTVSNEINIRNNYAYDILPNIDDHIIFYHDKGFEQNFEIYDQQLRYKTSRQGEFEKKNINPIGVLSKDTSFNFYYSYRDDGYTFVRVNQYDKYVSLIDSATLTVKEKKSPDGNPRFAFSDDKSKVLIFTPEDKNLNLLLIDNIKLEIIYGFSVTIKDFNFKSDFEKLILSNNGDIFILGRKSSFWNKKENESYTLVRIIDANQISVHRFTPETDEIGDLIIDYDERNQKLVMAGLTTSGDYDNANGYFGFSLSADQIPEDAEILVNKFSMEFMADVSGKKPGKIKELSNLRIRDLVVRNDGGVIVIAELVKEFTRRSQMNVTNQFGDYFPPRGFIDYYHEDVILLATFAEGKEHWKKVLFKKQFSQDDDGIFSSYFLFKTPSRLRLLYNDEIKNNNTVSEYVIDGIGNTERKSVLSTEYQNLKLRFRDAIQIGPKSIIVPSEKSWKINLVRIDYD
ncbi:MAG: hypothetical protein H7X99_07260 [Saprospiraceae bacterium]|nr:hypothetical protein [Saprospiraceae bacterium]